MIIFSESNHLESILHLSCKFLFEIWKLIDGLLNLAENGLLGFLKGDDFGLDVSLDAFNEDLGTCEMCLITVAWIFSTDEWIMAALFIWTYKKRLWTFMATRNFLVWEERKLGRVLMRIKLGSFHCEELVRFVYQIKFLSIWLS